MQTFNQPRNWNFKDSFLSRIFRRRGKGWQENTTSSLYSYSSPRTVNYTKHVEIFGIHLPKYLNIIDKLGLSCAKLS